MKERARLPNVMLDMIPAWEKQRQSTHSNCVGSRECSLWWSMALRMGLYKYSTHGQVLVDLATNDCMWILSRETSAIAPKASSAVMDATYGCHELRLAHGLIHVFEVCLSWKDVATPARASMEVSPAERLPVSGVLGDIYPTDGISTRQTNTLRASNSSCAHTHLSEIITLLPPSVNRHLMTRRWQLAQGSSPEHFILLCRQGIQL